MLLEAALWYIAPVATLTLLSRADREAIRLRFFREFRGDEGCSSAAVRRDKTTGETYLSVGVVGTGARVPAEYEGLSVRAYGTEQAVHAVKYRTT